MAILDFNSTIRTTAGGQTTSAIITAANIGNYGISTTSTYYIGTTQNVFNRASAAQTLTGVSIDGTANNITAYTINQNVGTGNAPSFTGMTSTAMLVASTSMNSVDDWQNSPISIRERGLVAAAQSANTYSPNLNFHWASRISNSLWMDANGNLSWGSYDGTGVPSSDGAFYTNNLYSSNYYDKDNTAYYINAASTSIVNAFKVYDALYFGDYTTYLSQATPYLRITTANGYGNFGPANSSWFHMTTDRPNFYMAVGLHINGDLFIYNTQSQLTSTSVRAPIFYDSGDTTYYLDPANSGTSLLVAGKIGAGLTTPLHKIQATGLISASDATYNNDSTFIGAILNNDGTNPGLDLRRWNGGAAGTNNHGATYIATNSVGDTIFYNGLIAANTRATNEKMRIAVNGNVGIGATGPDTNLQVVGHVHIGNQTTFDNTGGWNKTIYLDGTVHARMRIIGSAFASGKNSQTETSIWVDNSVSPYSGLDTNAGSFRISAGFTTLTNSVRSPIFYDSDDTNYYVDPAGTSRVSTLYVANVLADSASLNGRILLYGNLHIDAYGANDIYCNYYSGRRFRTFKGAATGAEIFRTDTDGIVYAYQEFRTPILYDYNDTTYYIDPAATSIVSNLTINNILTNGPVARNTYSVSVNTSTYWTITRPNGLAIANPYIYKISLVTLGTGTDTGEQYIIANIDTLGWVVKTVTKTGSGSNWPYVFLDAGVPKVKTDHPNLYSVQVVVEEFNTGNSGGLPTAFGLEGAFTSDNGTPKYRAGWFSSDNTLLHSGNYSGYSAFSGSVSSGGNITATGYIYTSTYLQTGGNLIYPSGYGATQRLEVGNSANNNWIDGLTIAPGGIVTAPNEMRSPIFYDSDNTAYYINAASTSNLVGLTVANTITGNITGTAGGETIGTVSGRGNNTSTQLIVSTAAGQAMYVGRQIGGSYSYGSGGIFTALSDNTNGTLNAFFQGYIGSSSNTPGGTLTYSVRADGQIYTTMNTATGIANNSFNVAKTILGSIHIANGSGTSGNNNQAAITFQGSSSNEAQAGIYVSNNSSSGTAMAFATTDSYATGPQIFMSANNVGVVNFSRARPTYAGNTILDAANYSGYSSFSGTISGTAINIAGNGATADPYGTIAITEPAGASNYSYYGLTRQANIGAGFGLTGTNGALGLGANSFWFGTATSTSAGVMGSAYIAFNGSSLVAVGTADATQFRDKDNTAYYLDPANTGTSLLVAGSVGIGTTSASAKLHVAGTTGLYQSAGNTYLYYDHTGINTWRTGIFTDNTSTYIIGHDSGGTFATKIFAITMAGNVGIGTTGPSYKLQVNGSFAATTKSFDIPHPTKENKRLVYASLEGPENGVYVRGKNKTNIIELPDYWIGLVHEDSLSISLTPIGKNKNNKIRNYSVELIESNKVYIYTDCEDNIYDYYYIIHAERKDVSKLMVEKEIN